MSCSYVRLFLMGIAAVSLGGCASRGASDTVSVHVASCLGQPLKGAAVYYTDDANTLIVADRQAGRDGRPDKRPIYCLDQNGTPAALLSSATTTSGKASLKWRGRPIFAFIAHEQGYAVADIPSRQNVEPIRILPWSTVRADLSSRLPKGSDRLYVRFTEYLSSGSDDHCVVLSDVTPIDANGHACGPQFGAGRVRLSALGPQFPADAPYHAEVSLWTDVVDVTPGGYTEIGAKCRGCTVRGAVSGSADGSLVAQLRSDSSLRPWADERRPQVQRDIARKMLSYAARMASEDLREYQVQIGHNGIFEFPEVAPDQYVLTVLSPGARGSFHATTFKLKVRPGETHVDLGALSVKS